MTLSKNTELGQITVSNQIFAGILKDAIKSPDCEDKIWLSTKRGKLLSEASRSYISDIAYVIDVNEDVRDGVLSMDVYVITRFGASIKKVVDSMCSYVAEVITKRHGNHPLCINVHVTGVKSKNIARRELLIIKEYGRNEHNH